MYLVWKGAKVSCCLPFILAVIKSYTCITCLVCSYLLIMVVVVIDGDKHVEWKTTVKKGCFNQHLASEAHRWRPKLWCGGMCSHCSPTQQCHLWLCGVNTSLVAPCVGGVPESRAGLACVCCRERLSSQEGNRKCCELVRD